MRFVADHFRATRAHYEGKDYVEVDLFIVGTIRIHVLVPVDRMTKFIEEADNEIAYMKDPIY